MALIVRAAGSALAGLFTVVGKARRNKPLHPKGVVFDAVLRRTGAPQPWGTAWLDQPGEDHGLVRLSRAVGLPAPVPDILGLAFTFGGGDGQRHDLLLATTGLGPVSRFVLTPRRDPLTSAYSCLLPYSTPRGPLLLAAVPADGGFHMLAAAPRGDWARFGSLHLEPGGSDAVLRYDPILNPLPGLAWHRSLVQLREPAYAAARRAAPRLPPRTNAT